MIVATVLWTLLCFVQGTREPPGVSGGPPAASQSLAAAHPRVPVPEPSEDAIEYHRSGIMLWICFTVWSIVLPGFFLFTGLSARLRTFAQWIGRNWLFTAELYFIIFLTFLLVVNLPLDYFAGYVRPHAYGLSNQTFSKWLYDRLVSFGVELVAGVLVIWAPYLLIRKSPRRWWLYSSILAVPLLFVGMLVYPIWIVPLFNHVGGMKNKALEAKILALADRAGIDGARIFEVEKSVDTKAMNAYVAGFLDTKRIVLWDTLVDKLPEDQILFIVGHEMGHYVLRHVVQGLLVTSVLILLTLFLVHLCARLMLERFGHRLGLDQLQDVASLPLLLLLVNFIMLFTFPIGMAFSRHIEHEADRFGLEITQNNYAAAKSFVSLEEENLGMPRPNWLIHVLRGSHPTGAERIEFSNEYRPWEKGEPLKYGNLFRQK